MAFRPCRGAWQLVFEDDSGFADVCTANHKWKRQLCVCGCVVEEDREKERERESARSSTYIEYDMYIPRKEGHLRFM